MQLSKYHDPAKNKELLAAILNDSMSIGETTKETQELFRQIKQEEASEQNTICKKNWLERLWSLLAEDHSIEDPHHYSERVEGDDVVPEWKPGLDKQYEELETAMVRRVNVVDFGAVGDGATDCTAAFQKALGNGQVDVFVPAGVYVVRKLELPSWTRIAGAGKGATVIKLHGHAPKRQRLLANQNFVKGNHHISVENLGLDWNVERLGDAANTSAGNNFSSCLTFANVTYGWVKQVAAVNPGLHCFDISSTIYNYGGDGRRARGGSRYVWLDRVNGYGFGDDGITTHHSDYIFISNSHFCDPSGRSHKKGFSNSNGIEIDDGSRFVWLLNNSTARCFGGVEIKAHATSSAATGVFISGHLSVNDNRSFNFRHIGHHLAEDPQSLSAFNIAAQRLVSVAPVFTDMYAGSAPRALVVSGFKNVAINRFLFIGDPDYDYQGNPAAAIQYKAARVSLANGRVAGFKKSSADIYVAGGKQGADRVVIQNIRCIGSAEKPVKIGKGHTSVVVENVKREKVYQT
ncbi:glycosyl hydrolase family 28-related protein [Planococcus shenhongbingii]|uniref:glycosyl hydrolase family 28-related protein n=1 Tax=Planococcus shenhongbingii TaxID=3058398 RepID=UPI00261985F8|nr:glycosyl hydrolase family 28-related protein [Planococcus sp. N016]WKA60038.1 glycosyl hydrolase family 28-related protein [Planococcus sp. N016]